MCKWVERDPVKQAERERRQSLCERPSRTESGEGRSGALLPLSCSVHGMRKPQVDS